MSRQPIDDMTGWALCPECSNVEPILDEFEDQEGFEEKARRVWVKHLACGHQEVTYR